MWTAGHIRRWITLQVCPSRIRRHICWWSQELRQVMLRLLVEDDSMIWCGLDNYVLWRQKNSFAAHACVIVLSQKHERQKFEISKPANLWHRGRLRPAALFSLRQNCDCFVYNYVWTCHVRKTFIKALGPGYLAKLTGKAKKEHLFYQHQGRGLCKYWLLQIQ